MVSPPLELIRVLVVDDEMPARQRLVDLLRKDAEVGSILEAEDGRVAVDLIHNHPPDLVYLDCKCLSWTAWESLTWWERNKCRPRFS